MQIEVRVSPHSESLKYYQIHWRKKKRFNLFNYWKGIYCFIYLSSPELDQPLLFSNFNKAVEYAMKIKENPDLIFKHNAEELEKYNKAIKNLIEHRKERNKSIII